MTVNDSTSDYRGYPLVKHPSEIVGIFPMPNIDSSTSPISTASSLTEAKQIIDAWLDGDSWSR